MLKKKMMLSGITLAIVGALTITAIAINKKTRKKACDLVDTIIDEAEIMM